MLRNLLPKTTDFFDFFEAHSKLSVETCRELHAMMQPGGDIALRAARIKDLEREADSVTHACTEALHKTFITPVDRADILKLIQRMDDIVDSVESIASRVVLYEISEPRNEAQKLAEVLVRASLEIASAVSGLRDMKNGDHIKQHCIVLFDLENQGDDLMRAALAELFKNESNPIEVIKWKEIFERLERATDRCESVANIILGIVIEAS